MDITCPHCKLKGKVSEEKLDASSGKLRCPRCKKIFSPEIVVYIEPDEKTPSKQRVDVSETRKKKSPVESRKIAHDEEPLQRSFDDLIEPPSGIGVHDDPLLGELGELGAMGEQDSLLVLEEEDLVALGEESTSSILMGEEIPKITDAVIVPEDAETIDFKMPLGAEGMGIDTMIGAENVNGEPKKFLGRSGRVSGALLATFVVTLIFGVIYFFSFFEKMIAAESAFVKDSEALYTEYAKLVSYLKVGIPDNAYIIKVTEMAYYYDAYHEKYEMSRSPDSLYVALICTGRLFLASKELLERGTFPEVYYALEWGEKAPVATMEAYRAKLMEELALCQNQIDKNIELTKKIIEQEDKKSMVDRMWELRQKPKRSFFASDLKKINADFLKNKSTFLPLRETTDELLKLINKLPE